MHLHAMMRDDASRRRRPQGFLRQPARPCRAAAARALGSARAVATSRTGPCSGSASPHPISVRSGPTPEPYRRAHAGGARRHVMAEQGQSLSVLVEETDLPLPDECADRILLVHMLEWTEKSRELLRELWRVLAPNGRLLVIVPNRRGLWARVDSTPFGYGSPFCARSSPSSSRTRCSRPRTGNTRSIMPPFNWRVLLTGRLLGAARACAVARVLRRDHGRGEQADLCGVPVSEVKARRRIVPVPAGVSPKEILRTCRSSPPRATALANAY